MQEQRSFVCRLLQLPGAIAAAEEELLSAQERVRVAQEALQRAEDALILAGVEGKNEAQRAAAVRAETQTEREMVTACEYRLAEAKIRRGQLRDELSALKAICRLMEVTA